MTAVLEKPAQTISVHNQVPEGIQVSGSVAFFVEISWPQLFFITDSTPGVTDFDEGMKDIEEGRTVDLDIALTQLPSA